MIEIMQLFISPAPSCHNMQRSDAKQKLMDHLKKADFEAKCKAKEKEYLKDYLVTKGKIRRNYRGARRGIRPHSRGKLIML